MSLVGVCYLGLFVVASGVAIAITCVVAEKPWGEGVIGLLAWEILVLACSLLIFCASLWRQLHDRRLEARRQREQQDAERNVGYVLRDYNLNSASSIPAQACWPRGIDEVSYSKRGGGFLPRERLVSSVGWVPR